MDNKTLQPIADILKMRGCFQESNLLNDFLEGNITDETLYNKLSDLVELAMLSDIESDNEGENENFTPSKKMVVCGNYMCDLFVLQSITTVTQWDALKSTQKYGLKFVTKDTTHTEYFYEEKRMIREKQKLIKAMANKSVLFL